VVSARLTRECAALANDPQLLLLDEATGDLDTRTTVLLLLLLLPPLPLTLI
jgi:ABC-type methionine transport system ATPase subunit